MIIARQVEQLNHIQLWLVVQSWLALKLMKYEQQNSCHSQQNPI